MTAVHAAGAALTGPSAAHTGTPLPAHAETPVPAQAEASVPALVSAAASAGLHVLAAAQWPEVGDGAAPPPVPGFVGSSFSPLAAEVARRCLERVGGAQLPMTAVLVASALGDLAGAVRVAEGVDGGARLGPLLFFQAVPNAVAGLVASRWGLTGPVVCVGDTAGALAVAALLLADGDAEAALLLRVDQAYVPGGVDRAAAVLLGPEPAGDGSLPHQEGVRP
ncbi:beta-ketoacyl synthase N-terminal-like domain-containing protein [Streptomyces sp. TLI_171]|uniref:beta-ketoacyl synthase N-terminal-like domain-containing protein n=1 Tax=Streptomyces sp. TLI_171 TaxID=1938859 RepID=UPI000C5667F8|nr:beta-ketoacyl synthase N-terminal-like domain-containing protein [Streptomyces sp. TLI_171]RKE23371.1 beta-ketoacyl synthase-like protein [Streptomyces sp. TLI_171]